jgi:flagellar biosynthesis chaperone FliJ
MSFLKNILSPFVEFKEEGQKGTSNENKSQTPERKAPSNFENTRSFVNTAVSPDPPFDSKITASSAAAEYEKHFQDLIDEANAKNSLFQGTDFKEFIDSKIDVEAITDEATRYRTAFNVLKRTGLTKERLVTTGQEYINIIERDLKGFEVAYKQHYQADVEQKEQILKKKADELHALNEKISVLNQEIKQMSQQIIQTKEQLNSKRSSFLNAGDNKKKEIQFELEKINQFFQ